MYCIPLIATGLGAKWTAAPRCPQIVNMGDSTAHWAAVEGVDGLPSGWPGDRPKKIRKKAQWKAERRGRP